MGHNFRELNVWKRALNLVVNIYKLSGDLPDEQKFGLKSQLQRSAVSIPSNIAEGSGRGTDKDFNRFLDIALASSYECETQLMLIKEIYRTQDKDVEYELNEVQKMIVGLKKSL